MMSKRYKIVITEFTQETKAAGREWEKGAEPSTEEKPEGWGYSPEIEKKADIERQIFVQNTDDLDLVEVIKAVNGI